ncbi:MAG: YbaB/EbfC family nucleoid-associated protein [Bacteroidia bacterium]|nr:YbaB/EbfC family nucleoid-associated protein [Bacteroidia bacterium]MCX7651522.1 YbaB/EbfC family nucleoid-associated protein [Bacteroidia bacterium]MDW8416819.1 YbaB/EbfC family nucleoid-associated protein [Bacteroidia bacterium]
MWDFLKAFQKMQELAQELEKTNVVGSSTDKTVQITLSGHQIVQRVEIDDSVLGKREALEKAIAEAFNDAREKLQQLVMEKLGGGTLPPFLPGNIGLG